MPLLLWDASSLIKRYSIEQGRDTVNTLFASVPLSQMVMTYWGYAETYAILVRKRNDGRLAPDDFTLAVSALYLEAMASGDFGLLSIDDETVMDSIPLIVQHNLNATDAVLLTAYFEYARSLPPGSPSCVLIAADQRLLRAAQAEGFQTLNPETLPAADVADFLASLA